MCLFAKIKKLRRDWYQFRQWQTRRDAAEERYCRVFQVPILFPVSPNNPLHKIREEEIKDARERWLRECKSF